MGDPESRLRPPRTNAARQVSVEKGAAPERGGEGLCERVCFDRVNEREYRDIVRRVSVERENAPVVTKVVR